MSSRRKRRVNSNRSGRTHAKSGRAAKGWRDAPWDIVAALMVAIVTFGFSVTTFPPPPTIHDAYAYTAAADRLLSSGVYAYGPDARTTDVAPNARVTPGEILVLALSMRLTTASGSFENVARAARPVWWGVQFAGALATVLFITLAARRLAGRTAGVVTGIAAALYVPFAWWTTVALGESLAATTLAAALWLSIVMVDERTSRPAIAGAALGAVAGIAVMLRPATVLWFLTPFVYLAWVRRDRLARVGGVALSAALALAIVMAPWWARNATTLGMFVPIRTDYVRSGNGLVSIGSEAPMKLTWQQTASETVRAVRYPWTPQLDVLWENEFHYDTTRVDFTEFPESLLESVVRWREWAGWYQVMLLIAAVLGLATLSRRYPQLWFVFALPVSVIATHWNTQVIDRYFAPSMPSVILLAGLFAWHAGGLLRERMQSRRGARAA